MPKQEKLRGPCSWICTAVLDINLYNQSRIYEASAEKATRTWFIEAHPCGKMFLWKIVLGVLNRKRLRFNSLYQSRKTNAPPTKGTNATVFLILKRCILSHVCNPSVWYFLRFPAFVCSIHQLLFMAQCFPIDCWMLYCTVCRTILIKLQCLTWIIPLPYWEVFCVWCHVCNVFIVLWPIGVVAQNKA